VSAPATLGHFGLRLFDLLLQLTSVVLCVHGVRASELRLLIELAGLPFRYCAWVVGNIRFPGPSLQPASLPAAHQARHFLRWSFGSASQQFVEHRESPRRASMHASAVD
jgi:hypothetical protein